MFGSSRIKLVVSYGYSITQWRIVELDKNIHGFSSSRVRYVYYYTQIRRGGGGGQENDYFNRYSNSYPSQHYTLEV